MFACGLADAMVIQKLYHIIKIQNVFSFLNWLTQVVLEKRPL